LTRRSRAARSFLDSSDEGSWARAVAALRMNKWRTVAQRLAVRHYFMHVMNKWQINSPRRTVRQLFRFRADQRHPSASQPNRWRAVSDIGCESGRRVAALTPGR